MISDRLLAAVLWLLPVAVVWRHVRSRRGPGRLEGLLMRAHEQRRHEDRRRDREMSGRRA